MKKAGFVSLILILAFSGVSGQSADKKNLTIEEAYLQREQSVQALQRLSQASDIETRDVVMKEFEKMAADGTISANDKDYIAVLQYLATDGTVNIARENNRKSHDFPMIRMRACKVLYNIGGEEAEKILKSVLIYEEEPTVVSEAVYGLGMIGNNKDEKTAELIANMITKWDIIKPDNNLAFASLLAIKKIAEKNNGITNPEITRAVMRLYVSEGGYIKEVREMALEVFLLLRKYMQ